MPNAAARADAGSLPRAMSYPACDLTSLSNELAECDAFLSVCPEQDEGRLQRLLDQHYSLLVNINRISTRTLADLKIKVAGEKEVPTLIKERIAESFSAAR